MANTLDIEMDRLLLIDIIINPLHVGVYFGTALKRSPPLHHAPTLVSGTQAEKKKSGWAKEKTKKNAEWKKEKI